MPLKRSYPVFAFLHPANTPEVPLRSVDDVTIDKRTRARGMRHTPPRTEHVRARTHTRTRCQIALVVAWVQRGHR
jgi:hypothetical protein